jgi:dUTP pyrophosphatase
MEKNEIEDYIKKLKELERELNSDEPEDIGFLGELDKILGQLHSDIKTDFLSNPAILKVKFKKLHENAVVPKYAKKSDAGLDLVATSIISNTTFQITYGLGVALEIPEGFVGLVFPRSSIRNTELSLSNSVGVIDSGYRGELQATFNKTNGLDSLSYKIGDRVCQILILPYPKIEFIETDTLSDSDRGEGGFGSTGS